MIIIWGLIGLFCGLILLSIPYLTYSHLTKQYEAAKKAAEKAGKLEEFYASQGSSSTSSSDYPIIPPW